MYLSSGRFGDTDINLVLEQLPAVTPEIAARFGVPPEDAFTIAPALVTLSVSAQQPQKPSPEDVVRVNTDLVQSAITVVDKGGHFVEGAASGPIRIADRR